VVPSTVAEPWAVERAKASAVARIMERAIMSLCAL
jgi:hypothetical protein